jgi:hypothetical protein
MSKHENSIADGAAALLAPGEEIVSALVVSPRGSSTAAAPGLAPSEIGRRWSNKNKDAAERVGLVVTRSSGLALTNRRLLTLDLAISLTGSIKQVKELLSEVPLERVDEITSRWNVLTICAGGAQFKLECKPPRQRRSLGRSPPRRRRDLMGDVRRPIRVDEARLGHREQSTTWVFYELDYVRREAQAEADLAYSQVVEDFICRVRSAWPARGL